MMNVDERIELIPFMMTLDEKQGAAFVAYLDRLDAGEPIYDSLVAMHMDLGLNRQAAHAAADRTMAKVAH